MLCLANDKDGALNVYFVPDFIKISDGDTSSLCGYAYMGDNSKDLFLWMWIALLMVVPYYMSLDITFLYIIRIELALGKN